MKFLKDKEIKNAFLIGVISSIAYLVCYVARNLLSVVSPQMIESAGVSVEYIGTLSTAQMLFYAGGQLVNGIIGDKVKVKYMVGGGLVLSGVCNMVIGLIYFFIIACTFFIEYKIIFKKKSKKTNDFIDGKKASAEPEQKTEKGEE